HQLGIVHRDVKPGNILVTPDGTALITDFGISRAFGDASLTSTGMLTGTPAYLAPEVARGGSSTPAADVFSLGATLYAAVEGTPPFGAGDNPMALLHQVASGTIDPPRLAGALSGVLLAMLDPTPAQRPTMREASDALTRLMTGDSPEPERDPLPTTRVLPVTPLAGAVAAVPLGSEGGHTVELPSDPPDDRDEPDPLAPLAAAGASAGAVGAAASSGVSSGAPSLSSDTGPSGPPRPPGEVVDPRRRRRRRSALLAVAVAGVLALLVVWGLQRSSDPTGAAAPVPRSTPSSSPSTTRTSASAPRTTAAPTTTRPRPSTPTSTRTTATSATRPPTTPAPTRPTTTPAPATPTPTATPATTTGATAGGATPTSPELSAAVRDYYRLLPGDTDAGWALLTDRYKQTTATSRSYYDRFWGAVDKVQVSQVSSQAPSSVVATIRYVYDDGRVFTERTSYSLVRDGGRLKIDRSTVISSRQS
ncbi:MAG: hypothetical protein JWP82_1120, partial [Humibacillus sp.]|nr:hypothetical protein [Humibacillus sp.]